MDSPLVVVSSRKFFIDSLGKHQLTECCFDALGRKTHAKIFGREGETHYNIEFSYFDWGDLEVARYENGDVRYRSEFLLLDHKTSRLTFFWPNNSLITRFEIHSTGIRQEKFRENGDTKEIVEYELDHSRSAVDFLYEDLSEISLEIFQIETFEVEGKEDYKILRGKTKTIVEYYEEGRRKKIREVSDNGEYVGKFLTEIDYRPNMNIPNI